MSETDIFSIVCLSLTVTRTQVLLNNTSGPDKLNTIGMHYAALISETQWLKSIFTIVHPRVYFKGYICKYTNLRWLLHSILRYFI